MMYVSFSLPFKFFGMMRLPAMYFFLCGQFFSFIHSGMSAMASRFLIPCLSVLAINLKIFVWLQYAGSGGCQQINLATMNRELLREGSRARENDERRTP